MAGSSNAVTITIGNGQMFFVESTLSPEQREDLLRQDKSALKNLPPEEAKKKEEELKKLDVRTAIALDAKTGQELWRRTIDGPEPSGQGLPRQRRSPAARPANQLASARARRASRAQTGRHETATAASIVESPLQRVVPLLIDGNEAAAGHTANSLPRHS